MEVFLLIIVGKRNIYQCNRERMVVNFYRNQKWLNSPSVLYKIEPINV